MAPSDPASHPEELAGGDRRRTRRVAMLGSLHAEVTTVQSMDIIEVGLAGLQADTTFPLQLDSLHTIRLTLGAAALVVKGRVSHCAITDLDREAVRYRSGIEFVDSPVEGRRIVERFLQETEASRLRPFGAEATSD